VTLIIRRGLDKNLLESVPEYRQGKGLTRKANEKLYEADPSMEGKSPEERIKKYEELFGSSDELSIESLMPNTLGVLNK
jgi:hypothetical protein